MIEEGEIAKFQKKILNRYYESYGKKVLKLIKPSGNKNMNIPLHILTKFFIRFYTEEGYDRKFYSDLNRDLTNNKFDDYHPFIFLIYDCLNKGYIKPYRQKLFRGAEIYINKFNDLMYDIRKNEKEKILYFSKSFLSFSKDEIEAKKFLKPSDNNTVGVLFILEGCENNKFFITNIDIESLSSNENEKEVLALPFTCFEVVEIGKYEIYNGFMYRKIYLKYLDKYQKIIDDKLNDLWNLNDDKEIKDFFCKSMESRFGKDVQKCYNKKNKLSVNYAKMLNVPADNSFFLGQIASQFISKITGNQIAANIDDEFPNLMYDLKERLYKNNKNIISPTEKNRLIEIIIDTLKKIDIEVLGGSYSLGYCLGVFISNFVSFWNAPTASKCINIVSLALGCGLPAIKILPKLIPLLKLDVEKLLFNSPLNVEMISNILNIFWAVGIETYNIFRFHYEQKIKWSVTRRYIGKRLIKLGISVGFSITGWCVSKAIVFGIVIITGVSLEPWVTAVIGFLGGAGFGLLGNYTGVGNYLADKAFGEDQFILTSGNLYYKYIPEKYRKKGNNPHLKWNKTYLCAGVKSYIIECIENDVNTQMRVMNIPNDVFELKECLGYPIDKNSSNNDNNIDDSTDEDDYEDYKTFVVRKLTNENKFVGDLVIPYKGISENAFKIDFIIYGIDKEKISVKEWIDFKDKESKEKLIQVGFILSVY